MSARRFEPPQTRDAQAAEAYDQLARVLDARDPLASYPVRSEARITLAAGTLTRVRPPATGQEVVVPAAGAQNFAQTITLLVRSGGSLRVRPTSGTIGGAAALVVPAGFSGELRLLSDGESDWSGPIYRVGSDVTIPAAGEITLEAAGAVQVDAGTDIQMRAAADVEINGAGGTAVSAAATPVTNPVTGRLVLRADEDVDMDATDDVLIDAGDIMQLTSGSTLQCVPGTTMSVLGTGILQVGSGSTTGWVQLEGGASAPQTVSSGDGAIYCDDPTNGDATRPMWVDDDNVVRTLLPAQAAREDLTTQTNSTSNVIATSLLIPANTVRQGDTYRLRGTYRYDRGATATASQLRGFFSFGGAITVSTGNISTQTAAGSSGAIWIDAVVTFLGDASAATPVTYSVLLIDTINSATVVVRLPTPSISVTQDMTTDRSLSIRAQFTTAVADLSLTALQGTVERLR